jgi:hypothetical protein
VDPSTRVRISALAFGIQFRFFSRISLHSLFPDLACTGNAFTAPTPATQSFHIVKQEYAEASIRHAIEENRLNEDDAALIREFVTGPGASIGAIFIISSPPGTIRRRAEPV